MSGNPYRVTDAMDGAVARFDRMFKGPLGLLHGVFWRLLIFAAFVMVIAAIAHPARSADIPPGGTDAQDLYLQPARCPTGETMVLIAVSPVLALMQRDLMDGDLSAADFLAVVDDVFPDQSSAAATFVARCFGERRI